MVSKVAGAAGVLVEIVGMHLVTHMSCLGPWMELITVPMRYNIHPKRPRANMIRAMWNSRPSTFEQLSHTLAGVSATYHL